MTGRIRDTMSQNAKRRIELYVDGSCEPRNPGGNGVAGAYLCFDDKTDGRTRQLGCHSRMSNNVAEYEGLKLGLELCLEHGITSNFEIYSDSMLVVRQMTGKWKAKPGKMYSQSFQETLLFFRENFKVRTIEICWIPGAMNPADGFTRYPYEMGTKGRWV